MNRTLFLPQEKSMRNELKKHSKYSHTASLEQQQPKLCIVDAYFLELHTRSDLLFECSSDHMFRITIFQSLEVEVEIDNLALILFKLIAHRQQHTLISQFNTHITHSRILCRQKHLFVCNRLI